MKILSAIIQFFATLPAVDQLPDADDAATQDLSTYTK